MIIHVHVKVVSCNMVMSGLPDSYVATLEAQGLRAYTHQANHERTCYNCYVPWPLLLVTIKQFIKIIESHN